MVIQIPRQLQHPDFRFLRLRRKAKEPIAEETNWQEKNYRFDDKKLIEHLEKDMNYAIIGGYGKLILIDADTKEIEKICEKMIPTFTIKTGSPEEWKKHYFFITDMKVKGIRLTEKKVGDLGDVRSIGQYVVAPNSIHPKGGTYEVLKDLPIMKIGVNQIKEYFKDYLGAGGSETFKEYPTITTKRSNDFIRNCRMPDYVINNKIKGETSKNWELFPYLVDILHNREVTQQVYMDLCKRQGHNVGSIKGWVKKAHEGKLMQCNCKKMQDYINKFHPQLKEEICGQCSLYKKKDKKKEEYLFSEFGKLTNYLNIAEEFIKIQPIYYDKYRLWWIWNFKEYKWEIIDETDIFNLIDNVTKNPSTNSTIKNELLEGIRRKARLNKPKEPKDSWVQFGDKIYNLENDKILDATSEYFITNPIKWKFGENEETLALDILFKQWVGEDHYEELYEILAFCIVPNYFIHRLFCLIGSGANGKSTFLNVLSNFVSEENLTSSSLYLLLKARFEGSKLLKKLVCLMGETNFDMISNTDYLKKLTGQDLVRAEFKGKDGFDFRNYAKLIMATNSLPPTADKTEGFYRRWKIIDFPNKFPVETDVLINVLNEEYENLALKCFNIAKKLWRERRFSNDGDFEYRKKIYEDKSNPLMKFIKERFKKNKNSETFFQDFCEEFNTYLEERGHRLLSAIAVSRQLKNEGFDIKTLSKDNKNGRFIIGVEAIMGNKLDDY